jgi:hypothetical protein
LQIIFVDLDCREEEFLTDKASGIARRWTADVGRCGGFTFNYPECFANGQGKKVQVRPYSPFCCRLFKEQVTVSILQVLDVQKIDTGFSEKHIGVWKIEKVDLVENWIWPICLFNKGNKLDSVQTHNYRTYEFMVSISRSKKPIPLKKDLKRATIC